MRNLQIYKVLTLCLTLVVLSCQRGAREDSTLFSLLDPGRTGIDFVNRLTEGEEFNMIEYLYFNNGAGIAAGY